MLDIFLKLCFLQKFVDDTEETENGEKCLIIIASLHKDLILKKKHLEGLRSAVGTSNSKIGSDYSK